MQALYIPVTYLKKLVYLEGVPLYLKNPEVLVHSAKFSHYFAFVIECQITHLAVLDPEKKV